MTNVFDRVFNNDWHIWGHREVHGVSKGCCLREEVEVPHGEGKFARLIHFHSHLFLILLRGACGVSEHNVTGAEVTRDRELNALLGDRDGASVAKHTEVADDALELSRRHLDVARVFLLWNTEVLAFDVHKLHLEVGDAIVRRVLKHDGKHVPIVLRFKGHNVFVACALEDLAQIHSVESECHSSIAPVVIEAIRPQRKGTKRDVRRVHRLQADARLAAVEVTLADEVADGLNNLLKQNALGETCLQEKKLQKMV